MGSVRSRYEKTEERDLRGPYKYQCINPNNPIIDGEGGSVPRTISLGVDETSYDIIFTVTNMYLEEDGWSRGTFRPVC